MFLSLLTVFALIYCIVLYMICHLDRVRMVASINSPSTSSRL